MNPPSVRTIWARIEQVLREHSPETADSLASPASEDELRELEAAVGLSLPTCFKESLRVHNGQNDPAGCLWFSIDGLLLNTVRIAETWAMLTELDDGFRRREPDWGRCGEWWNRHWVPFTDAGGDSACINLDPRLGERAGEVIAFIHDNPHEPGVASSYEKWLESVAEKLERGEFTVEDGVLYPKIPD